MTSIIPLKLTRELNSEKIMIFPTLIKTDDALTLFDACLPDQIDQLEETLKASHYAIMDITRVIISHQDHDHIGSLADLKRRNNKLEVIASEIEEPYISGKKESLRIIQAREFNKTLSGDQLKWGESFLNYLKSIQPCEIEKIVSTDSENVDKDITILATPGHTPGHISLFVPSLNAFIAGDSMAIENNELVIANPQFTLDMETCAQTISRIGELNPEVIYCYHGGMIENKNNAKINHLLSKIRH